MKIMTKTEDIFRVTVYVPKGFLTKKGSIFFFNHKDFRSSKRIELLNEKIIYVVEFENIEQEDKETIKKFCRDQVIEMCRIEKKYGIFSPV